MSISSECFPHNSTMESISLIARSGLRGSESLNPGPLSSVLVVILGTAAHGRTRCCGVQASPLHTTLKALSRHRVGGREDCAVAERQCRGDLPGGMAMGKFRGVIEPITPMGSRVISTPMFRRTGGSTSPARRTRSPAKNLKICPVRTASPMPSILVLPSSRESKVPSSSRRRSCRTRLDTRSSGRKGCHSNGHGSFDMRSIALGVLGDRV